jgi:carbon starvation protein CstA
MEKFAKFAALGAAGVAGGTFVAYLALIVVFRPVANGGFDRIGWLVVSIAMLIPVAVLAGAHLAFARQLRNGAGAAPR